VQQRYRVPDPVATVVVSPGSAQLKAGAQVLLGAVTYDAAGRALPVGTLAWASQNSSVAIVSPAGLVTGQAPGTTLVAAATEGKSGTARIVVVPAVAVVTTLPETGTIVVGGTIQLTATAFDGAGAILNGISFVWVSGDPGTATVGRSGLVTGVAPGIAGISVAGGGATATSEITVVPLDEPPPGHGHKRGGSTPPQDDQ
jgi:uncharacterized protein YjdB